MRSTTREYAPERREPAPAWQAWLETAALPVALVAAGVILDGRDPFLLRRGFSWLAFAPLLAALRYGSIQGLACGAIQALALAVAWRWGGVPVPGSAPETVLGWLATGLVAGAFADGWSRRGGRLEVLADQRRLRLDGLARAYHALEASYQRLRRGAPGRPPCLREALDAFRGDLADLPDRNPLGAAGDRILALFSAHAFVRSATLHPVERDGHPGPALARLGTGGDPADDPLVRGAARLGEVLSVRDQPEGSLVLAAVPLVDVEGQVHAVVAIRDLPFVTLHDETLQLLALLGGHVGDAISQALVPALRSRRFFRSVSRAMADARRHGVPASLVVLSVKGARGDPASARRQATRIASMRRTSDDALILLDGQANPVVAILLKMADADGLQAYGTRLERLVRANPAAGGEVSIRGWPLTDVLLPRRPDEIRASLLALAARGAPTDGREGMEEPSWRSGAA